MNDREEGKGMRLLRKGKRGLIQAIFSRLGLIVLLFLLQLALLLGLFSAAAAFRDVACHARNLRVALFQMLLCACVRAEVAAPLANQLCRPLAQKPMPYITLGV